MPFCGKGNARFVSSHACMTEKDTLEEMYQKKYARNWDNGEPITVSKSLWLGIGSFSLAQFATCTLTSHTADSSILIRIAKTNQPIPLVQENNHMKVKAIGSSSHVHLQFQKVWQTGMLVQTP